MNWMIATPVGTALWKDGTLTYGPPVAKPASTDDSVLDELWLAYYRTTFNPARLRVNAMTKEMPKHYWRNLPETKLIAPLIADASARVTAMDKQEVDKPPLFSDRLAERERPTRRIAATPIAQLREEASACRRCPLYAPATRTVFGEGPMTHGLCSWANSRATRKILPVGLSSARRAKFLIWRLPMRVSHARPCTSRMR